MPPEFPPRPEPRKPTVLRSPAPPAPGSAPMPSTLSALGRLGESKRLPLPPPLPRVESSPKLLEAARVLLPPKSDPFPVAEAPTPVKRALPFRAGAIAAGTSQVARTFRNYEALSDENKRLVDALVLALRGTVDGGR